MPVRSPTIEPITSLDQAVSVNNDSVSLKKKGVSVTNVEEETMETVSKEKLANMKLIMKTFVTGALREKEQVNSESKLVLTFFFSFHSSTLERVFFFPKTKKKKYKLLCMSPYSKFYCTFG
jgi:hypothetical protein